MALTAFKSGLIILIILLHDWPAYANKVENASIRDELLNSNEYRHKLRIRALRGRLQTATFRFVISGAVSHRGGGHFPVFCEKVNPSDGHHWSL